MGMKKNEGATNLPFSQEKPLQSGIPAYYHPIRSHITTKKTCCSDWKFIYKIASTTTC